jgi:hypothetical protein
MTAIMAVFLIKANYELPVPRKQRSHLRDHATSQSFGLQSRLYNNITYVLVIINQRIRWPKHKITYRTVNCKDYWSHGYWSASLIVEKQLDSYSYLEPGPIIRVHYSESGSTSTSLHFLCTFRIVRFSCPYSHSLVWSNWTSLLYA